MESTRASKELEAIMKDNEEVKDEGEDEDEDEGQLLSSSTSITATTQRFSGFIAGFAFASQNSGGVRQNKPPLSDDTTSRTRTAIQTSTAAFHSSSNSPSTKRKRKGKEAGDNVATSRQTLGDSNNKKRKVNDIAHLPPLEDRLDMYLDVIICGCNPGHTSALVGFHYGNVHNAFWKCLHQSGFTEVVLAPNQGPTLPRKYSIGLTDLVATPSHGFADISPQERRASVETLLCKIAQFKPRVLALNSFTIWNDIASVLEKQLKSKNIAVGDHRRIGGAKGSRKKRKADTTGRIGEDAQVDLPRVKLEPPLDSREYPPLKLAQVSENRTPAFLPWKIVYEDSMVQETLIMPLPGTSGANAGYSLSEKISFFKAIHDALPGIKRGETNTSHMGLIKVSQDIAPA